MTQINIEQPTVTAPKGAHVLFTGPISGTVTKEDGTVVDVSPVVIVVADQDEADEISFLIGERHVAEGHPNMWETDDATGERVQRPFEHAHPKKFDKHPAKFSGKPAGTPRKKG